MKLCEWIRSSQSILLHHRHYLRSMWSICILKQRSSMIIIIRIKCNFYSSRWRWFWHVSYEYVHISIDWNRDRFLFQVITSRQMNCHIQRSLMFVNRTHVSLWSPSFDKHNNASYSGDRDSCSTCYFPLVPMLFLSSLAVDCRRNECVHKQMSQVHCRTRASLCFERRIVVQEYRREKHQHRLVHDLYTRETLVVC
jgi:phosphoribosyl-AMP cyclohydrolase